ncbi:hypothetical protein AMK59_8469 [Oryctes borbonicus]|uniref:Uncharacterized protein n=1 Tax=Oryctes borbonicus TaxID=1629725 RepID=A0A0T6AWH0_9SCAR|nr:hypothetical protein AMK59_8469 [Oryctes borbonicus]
MTKFATHAPFGVQTKRFAPIGYHPKLDSTGLLRAHKTKLSPCDYYPKEYECQYKKVNKAVSVWKRKADCEQFAENLGFRNHALLEQRKYYKAVGGPGSYDISEDIYKKKSHSVRKDVNFGNEVKFFHISDYTPAPGTYTGNILNSCLIKRQLTSKPPFEWDGFVDRFKTPSKSWSKPPNLYNPKDVGSIEALLNRVVSKKGPYNLFTGPRDSTTIKNHFAPPKRCTPDKYYTWPNGLDYLLHHPSKRRCGSYLKDARFRKKPTVRMLIDDLATCYRNPHDPSPATYDTKFDSITKLEPTMHPFNDSVPIVRKGVKWTITPGPGRYNVSLPKCKKVKAQSWVFKSKTGRTEYKPTIYSLFPE